MIDKNYEKQIIEMIQNSEGATIPLIIKDLIQQNTSERTRLLDSWNEYKGEVPIKFKPKLANKYAPDNRPVNAYRNLIVSEKVGYLTGVPIEYEYPPDATAEKMILDFLKINKYESLDANTMTYLAATGKAFRLLYIGKNFVTAKAELRVTNQLPWECLVVTDATLDNLPVYGMIYYQVEIKTGGSPKWRWKVEFYDDEEVSYWIENDSGNFVPDDSYFTPVEKHGFNIMPLVEFNNNLLKYSDFELVRTLCDAYDNAVSYALNDNESFSNALMIFKDVTLTQDLIDKARYLRGIEINSTPTKPDPSVTYLTKDIKIDNTNELCKMLEENIFKFSSTVDIYNEAFSGGSVSGESRKQQLIPLELKCKETERLFQQAVQNEMAVAATYWQKVNNTIVIPSELEMTFIRSVIPTEQDNLGTENTQIEDDDEEETNNNNNNNEGE